VPSTAVDRRGAVYVTWQEDPTPSTGRILLSRSVDDGRTWSAPRAIVDHAGQAYLPVVAVDRSDELGLLWYDARTDMPGDGRLDTAVWFAHSHDGGRTWRSMALTGIFDALSGPDWYGAGRDIGHYIALAPTSNGFDAAFAQAKPVAAHGDTDLFYAQIALG
jgi:Neuraminidase (sialidase)